MGRTNKESEREGGRGWEYQQDVQWLEKWVYKRERERVVHGAIDVTSACCYYCNLLLFIEIDVFNVKLWP